MADVDYIVQATLRLAGGNEFNSGLNAGAKEADKLQTAVGRMAGGVAQAASSLADFGARAVAMAASVAGAATMTGVAVGAKMGQAIGSNLSMLENKSIQLGTVIAAAAEVPFDKARLASNKLFDQFRKDAVTSAGETADFINIASMLTGPIVGAGKSMEDLHTVTKGVIAAAPGMGISFEQAGSDVMRMLQGVAGVEQPFFRAMVAIPSLGIKKAEEFNKLSIDKRYEKISKALGNDAFLKASEAAGNSFTGLLSTAEDIVKTMGGLVGTPIYEFFKRGFGSLTSGGLKLLDDQGFRTKLEALGGHAELMMRRVGAQMSRIFPDFNTGANGALDILTDMATTGMGKLVDASRWVADHWGEIKTFAKEAGSFIRESVAKAEQLVTSLGGGNFAVGAERLAKAFVAIKGAEAVAPTVIGGAVAAKGAADLGRLAYGALGGGAAASAGAAGGTAAGAGAGTGAASAAAGIGMAGAAAVTAAVAALGMAAYQAKGLYDDLQRTKQGKQTDYDYAKRALGEVALRGNDTGQASAYASSFLKATQERYAGTDELRARTDEAVQFINQQMLLASQMSALNTTIHDQAANAVSTPAEALVQAYNDATLTGNTALQKMAAETLLRSGLTAKDIEEAKLTIAGGLGVFSEMFKGASVEVLDALNFFKNHSPNADINTKGKKTPPSSSGTVTIKWDLGDGDEDALFVRSRRSLLASLNSARSVARMIPLPGGG